MQLSPYDHTNRHSMQTQTNSMRCMGLEQGVASCDGSCPRASEHTKHQHPAHLTAHLARSLMPSLSLVPAYDSARARRIARLSPSSRLPSLALSCLPACKLDGPRLVQQAALRSMLTTRARVPPAPCAATHRLASHCGSRPVEDEHEKKNETGTLPSEGARWRGG